MSNHTRSIATSRRAPSPYNFVSLPDPQQMLLCLSAEDLRSALAKSELDVLLDRKLPAHDVFLPKRYSGYFDVEMQTLSLVYVRSSYTSEELGASESDEGLPFRQRVKNKPDFFYTHPNTRHPVIPGSSLRGTLRSIVEVITFGKMHAVERKSLFFRDPSNRESYQERITESSTHNGKRAYKSRVRTGFLEHDGDRWRIRECEAVRVEMEDVWTAFGLASVFDLYELDGHAIVSVGDQQNPNQTPRQVYQHSDVWLSHRSSEQWQPHQGGNIYLWYSKAAHIQVHAAPGMTKGKLALTGPMQKKHMAFVFLDPLPRASTFNVAESLIDAINSDVQLTDWQRTAFPPGGLFREGQPVFFLAHKEEVTALGRAQMFRIGYTQDVNDLLPAQLRNATHVDFAEAIFGFVRTGDDLKQIQQTLASTPGEELHLGQGHRLRAYGGRVFVTDATLVDPNTTELWLVPPQEPALVPKILASPKPSSYQLYLTQPDQPELQPDPQGKKPRPQLSDYNDKNALLRGHKRYWHQGCVSASQIAAWDVPEGSSQHTQIRPVNANVLFKFRVYFDNLLRFELGALEWALSLGQANDAPTRYCHSIGMGKPLGLGAVRLRPTLHLIDRQSRYRSLFSDDDWSDAAEPASENFAARFEADILKSPAGNGSSQFGRIPRIEQLLRLMSWQDELAPSQHDARRYQLLDAKQKRNDFRDRRVLPDPRDVP